MNITEVREQLHQLIDEIEDIYVLNGLYRNLVAEKRHRDEYEKEQSERKQKTAGRKR
ncbi:hypothetical protein [Tellurirhabdus rosea]|uniref:hypothetical protein n=1 Tax=Tellurirhabdus rosea TaxID=2674997 RepID=UPI00224E4B56|nr:hypothetical protein [Tellurirhabdus rosea]